MECPDESTWIGVIKSIKLRPLDRDPTIKMHFHVLDLSHYNSLLKQRALYGDPVDHESTRSTRLIDKFSDLMLLIMPRHLQFKNYVKLSAIRKK